MSTSAPVEAPAAPPLVIQAHNLGIRFRRNRIRHRRLSDLRRSSKGQARSEFWALRNVTFEVPQGESVGIVGANGQGKSTLLKLVAGLLIPDEGSVSLVGDVAPLVNISGGFKGDLTVRDNLHIVGGLHGMLRDELEAKFDDIIEFAEVGDFVDTPFRHLSSGMRTRVAFSLITSLDAPTVIIDETLSVGDRSFKRKAYERLDTMLAGGKTLFLVSHSEKQLQRLCTRGIYLRRGRVVADGDIGDVIAQYASDRELEGHPGWKGERRRARRDRRRRRREAEVLAAAGALPAAEEIDDDDDGPDDAARDSGRGLTE
jgi:ABC-2 type transport system ATP-binding protein